VRVAASDNEVRDTAEQDRRLVEENDPVAAAAPERETDRYRQKNFSWGASCRHQAIGKFKHVLFRFGRNCSVRPRNSD